jgi:hypothetical protein
MSTNRKNHPVTRRFDPVDPKWFDRCFRRVTSDEHCQNGDDFILGFLGLTSRTKPKWRYFAGATRAIALAFIVPTLARTELVRMEDDGPYLAPEVLFVAATHPLNERTAQFNSRSFISEVRKMRKRDQG